MKHKIYLYALLLLIPILLLKGAIAFSISPNNVTLTEGQSLTNTIRIINSEKKDLNILVYAEGPGYTDVKETIVHLPPDKDYKDFSYKINIPPAIGQEQRVKLIFSDINSKESRQHSINIAPIYKKHLKAAISIREANEKEPIYFDITMDNIGEQNIASAKIILDIYDQLYNRVAIIESEELFLAKKETMHKSLSWPETKEGKYLLKATIYYDTLKLTQEKNFLVGTNFIELKKIGVKNNRLLLELRNMQDSDLNDVKGYLYLKEDKKIADFSFALKENIVTNIDAQIDSSAITEGRHTAKLTLESKDKLFIKTLDITLDNSRLFISRKNRDQSYIITIVVIILIILNTSLVVLIKRRKK